MNINQDIVFSRWKPWRHRERASDDIDVPSDFGISGIYMLGIDASGELSGKEASHIDPNVIYIGITKSDVRRIQGSHQAVKDYRHCYSDPECNNLLFSFADLGFTSYDFGDDNKKAKVRWALIMYFERKLIVEYALVNDTLPEFNKV
jgi:hypothetical protein